MMDIQKIIDCENNFPISFAEVVERPFGRIFYNNDNPESYDSNHALILNLDVDLPKSVDEIIAFYMERGLPPRIYHSFLEREQELLFPVLQEKGLAMMQFENHFLLHKRPSTVSPHPELQVRQINAIDPEIVGLVHTEDEGDWTIRVLERHLHCSGFYLFGGYRGDKPVTIVSLKLMDGYSRVDDMITHAAYRNQGYGRSIVHHLVNFHAQVSRNQLYLYVNNPIAYRMYQDAGFVHTCTLPGWVAWKE